MFLEHPIDIKECGDDSKIIDIAILKYNLIIDINTEIEKLLKKKYKKIQKKKI